MPFSWEKNLCTLISSLIITSTSACSEAPNPACLNTAFAIPTTASIETYQIEEIHRADSLYRVYYLDHDFLGRKNTIRECHYFDSGNAEGLYSRVPLPLLDKENRLHDQFQALDYDHGSAVIILHDLSEQQQGYVNVLHYTTAACYTQQFAREKHFLNLTYVEVHLPPGQNPTPGAYQGKIVNPRP